VPFPVLTVHTRIRPDELANAAPWRLDVSNVPDPSTALAGSAARAADRPAASCSSRGRRAGVRRLARARPSRSRSRSRSRELLPTPLEQALELLENAARAANGAADQRRSLELAEVLAERGEEDGLARGGPRARAGRRRLRAATRRRASPRGPRGARRRSCASSRRRAARGSGTRRRRRRRMLGLSRTTAVATTTPARSDPRPARRWRCACSSAAARSSCFAAAVLSARQLDPATGAAANRHDRRRRPRPLALDLGRPVRCRPPHAPVARRLGLARSASSSSRTCRTSCCRRERRRGS
jgi:hypothetical protein